MPVSVLSPNDRYAFVGKTGAGKTMLAMVLASTFAQALLQDHRWQVWWLDSKGDKDDLAALRKWGFRNAASPEDQDTYGSLGNAFYIRLPGRDSKGVDTIDMAQEVIAQAYRRRHVIVVVDEYAQIVPSRTNPGAALRDVFQRGRGLNVGLIGLTQEPVYIPRQLISQASHLVLFSLSYSRDIKYIREMESDYESPNRMTPPHRYGFWWKHVDGTGDTVFFPDQQEWYKGLQVSLPADTMGSVANA